MIFTRDRRSHIHIYKIHVLIKKPQKTAKEMVVNGGLYRLGDTGKGDVFLGVLVLGFLYACLVFNIFPYSNPLSFPQLRSLAKCQHLRCG